MHTFHAMNTGFSTAGLPRSSQVKAESWFSFVEKNLSRFSPASELSALNRSAGRPFMASALLYQALSAANRFYEETDGLFNPYMGRLLSDLGYGTSFETISGTDPKEGDAGAKTGGASGRRAGSTLGPDGTALRPIGPDGTALRPTGSAGTAFRHAGSAVPDGRDDPSGPESPIRPGFLLSPGSPAALNDRMMSVTLSPGASVDLGGFAKGWSADQLSAMLRKEGVHTGAIDAGGDIVLWGCPPGGWEIGVASPFAPDRDLLSLRTDGAAGIATSSRLKRRWRDESGAERHHLLDPRTSLPAESDLVQATVLAPTLTEAEVYAKCLLILGSEAGIPWLRSRRPRCAYVAVREDGTVLRDPSPADREDEGGLHYADAI